MTTRPLTSAFRSVKHPITRYSCPPNPSKPSSSSSRSVISSHAHLDPNLKASWCVYLIVSTGVPIKTYVGVTVDFCRRLKQHNGELKGGAKASRAGRPWNCACLIQGFRDRSQACAFESKWKGFSRKMPRKRKDEDTTQQTNDRSLLLLQHRHTALNRVKDSFDCSCLEIDWKLCPF
ncbi:structure-specific endonuclease subunit slx1 [Tripterygium wilfordii]|uniref:structure-specific endonuclease subunit slx1 n=1 Tax=Tripterygium wilfordii TaxID=458696 RepID=UPI0018F82C2D|nr:structure-specific endonuclease subunit slx1 [Tripterygium wilfordii]